MFRRILIGLLLLSAVSAQTVYNGGGGSAFVGTGTSLPGTCTTGQLYFKTDATAGQQIYECSSTNTWTQQLNSGSGGASAALDNLSSVSINTSLLAQTGVDLGSTAKPVRNVFLFGAGTYGTTSLEFTGTPTGNRVWTFQDSTDTVVGRATTDTLTNKSIAATQLTGVLQAAQEPAHTGDVQNSAGSLALTIQPSAVTLVDMANMATASFLGRNTAGTGVPEVLSATVSTAILNACTATLKGLVPAPPNNTTTFLRGDCTFAAPSGSGTVTVVGGGTLTSTALVTGGGSQTIQTPSATATLDTSGNISTPGTITTGVGSGISGKITWSGLTSGTAAISVPAVAGTPADIQLPSATGTANYFWMTNGASPQVTSWSQVGLTTSVTGTLPLTNGGTNGTDAADNGGIVYSNASGYKILAHTTTANQALLSGNATTPAWSTATYPATTTVSQLLYSSSANVIAGLATGNNGVLITSGGGVPSISSTLPSGITLVAPVLGTPASVTLTNGTGYLYANLASPPFVTNAKSGTYQVLAGDFSQCKTIPVASGTFTITLVASGSQPASGQCIDVINYGSGVVTIARSGQNLNGGTASIVLGSASATVPSRSHIVSDGTDYFASADFGNPMTTAGDTFYAGTTGLPTRLAGAAGIYRSSGTVPSYAELSGDATTSGSNAVTNTKLNGIAYSATAAAHTVEVITTANTTATAKVLPDCTDSGGNHINYTQSTDAFSCGTSGNAAAGTAGASLFSTTNSTTVTATSPTTLIGTVSGNTTLPANTFIPGFTHITANGFYSTPATPVSLTIDLKIGGSIRITTGAVVQIASVTNGVWNMACDVFTRTTGASGTQIANCIFVGTGSTLTPGEAPLYVSATWTIDTTATQAIDIQATWSTATGSPTITSIGIAAEIPGAPVTSVFGVQGVVGAVGDISAVGVVAQMNGTNFTVNTSGVPTKIAGVTTAGEGTDIVVGVSNLTAQTASLGTTTIATAPGAGAYTLKYYGDMSTAGSGCSVSFSFQWTDATTARTLNTGNLNLVGQSTGGYIAGEFPLWIGSGNFTYTSTVTGSCGAGAYDVHPWLERAQ